MRDRCDVPMAIAMSGCTEEEETERAHVAGFADYLVKPFPVMSLSQAISRKIVGRDH